MRPAVATAATPVHSIPESRIEQRARAHGEHPASTEQTCRDGDLSTRARQRRRSEQPSEKTFDRGLVTAEVMRVHGISGHPPLRRVGQLDSEPVTLRRARQHRENLATLGEVHPSEAHRGPGAHDNASSTITRAKGSSPACA